MLSHWHVCCDTIKSPMTLIGDTVFQELLIDSLKTCIHWLTDFPRDFQLHWSLLCASPLFVILLLLFYFTLLSAFTFSVFFFCCCCRWVVSWLLSQWDTTSLWAKEDILQPLWGKKLSCCVERECQASWGPDRPTTGLSLEGSHLPHTTSSPSISPYWTLSHFLLWSCFLPPSHPSGFTLLGSPEASNTTGHSLFLDTHPFPHNITLPGIFFSSTDHHP